MCVVWTCGDMDCLVDVKWWMALAKQTARIRCRCQECGLARTSKKSCHSRELKLDFDLELSPSSHHVFAPFSLAPAAVLDVGQALVC